MTFLGYLVIMAATMVLQMLLTPTVEHEDAKRGDIDDFSFPTNMENRAIPLAFGTNKITGPNLIWYGDLRSVPIREDYGTWVSSNWVTVGWQYFLGFDLAICAGPVDAITEIQINKKSALSAGFDGVPAWGLTDSGGSAGYTHGINLPDLEGGYKKGGGVVGTLTMYNGQTPTTVNSYLYQNSGGNASVLPGYPGLCRVVWEGGYVGEKTSIGDWAIVVHHYPNPLNLTNADKIVNANAARGGHGDANPMNVLYTILTDNDYGLGIAESAIDLNSFVAAAEILSDEGLGFSYLMQRTTEASKVIQELKDHCNCTLFQNLDGVFEVKLIRDDYTLSEVPSFDGSNIISVDNVARTAWTKTSNSCRVEYVNWANNFVATSAIAHDMGNIEMQSGQHNVVKKKFPGCRDAASAAFLAQRSLNEFSTPLVNLQMTTNRDGFLLNPGDIIKVTDADYGLDETPIRITEVTRGNSDTVSVKIKGVEDFFGTPAYINFVGGGDSLAVGATDAPTNPLGIELRGMTSWEYKKVGQSGELSNMEGWDQPNHPVRIHAYMHHGSAQYPQFQFAYQNQDTNNYELDGTPVSMTPSLVSQAPLDTDASPGMAEWKFGRESDTYIANGGASDIPAMQFNTLADDYDSLIFPGFKDQTLEEIQQQGFGMIQMGDEIMAYTTAVTIATTDGDLSPDSHQGIFDSALNGQTFVNNRKVVGISGVYRGLLDTDIEEHAPGERVYFLNWKDMPNNNIDMPIETTDPVQQFFKVMASGPNGRTSPDTAAVNSILRSEIRRAQKPLRPTNIHINGNYGEAGHNVHSNGGSIQCGFTVQQTHGSAGQVLTQTQNEPVSAQNNDGHWVDVWVRWSIGSTTIKSELVNVSTVSGFTEITREEIETAMGWTGGYPYNQTHTGKITLTSKWETYQAGSVQVLPRDTEVIEARVVPYRNFTVEGD